MQVLQCLQNIFGYAQDLSIKEKYRSGKSKKIEYRFIAIINYKK